MNKIPIEDLLPQPPPLQYAITWMGNTHIGFIEEKGGIIISSFFHEIYPAITSSSGREYFYLNNVFYRKYGPSHMHQTGTEQYSNNQIL